jgi:hypothetical protein
MAVGVGPMKSVDVDITLNPTLVHDPTPPTTPRRDKLKKRIGPGRRVRSVSVSEQRKISLELSQGLPRAWSQGGRDIRDVMLHDPPERDLKLASSDESELHHERPNPEHSISWYDSMRPLSPGAGFDVTGNRTLLDADESVIFPALAPSPAVSLAGRLIDEDILRVIIESKEYKKQYIKYYRRSVRRQSKLLDDRDVYTGHEIARSEAVSQVDCLDENLLSQIDQCL